MLGFLVKAKVVEVVVKVLSSAILEPADEHVPDAREKTQSRKEGLGLLVEIDERVVEKKVNLSQTVCSLRPDCLQSRPTASRKEKADVDALVISVDDMEESFVLDGGMKGSDASLMVMMTELSLSKTHEVWT